MIVYIAVALAALGIYMGVIEVKFHVEKLGNISAITQGVGSWQDVLAKAQYYGTVWKRDAERHFASSPDAKFNLDITYLKTDTNNLAKALDAKAGINVIVTKSRLLSETVNRTKDEMKTVSKDEIAKVRDDALKALAQAQVQLDRLKGVANQYKQAQDQLEQIIQSSPTPTPTPSKIPLKF